MPTNTPNLNLIKPLVSEKYTVAVANANNDILDTQVALLAPKANPTFTGTQTLPNIVTNGIKFPATQVPSADPNTFDDYEEGTWTPVVYGSTTAGVGTYGSQIGKYTKIGNTVNIVLVCVQTNHTGTGNMRISGLPFIPNGTFALPNNSYYINHTAGAIINAAVNNGQTIIVFDVISTTNSAYIGEPSITQNCVISISGTYFTT